MPTGLKSRTGNKTSSVFSADELCRLEKEESVLGGTRKARKVLHPRGLKQALKRAEGKSARLIFAIALFWGMGPLHFNLACKKTLVFKGIMISRNDTYITYYIQCNVEEF